MSRPQSGNQTNRARDLLYLFYRVGEPIYFPKGDPEETCYFDLSANNLPEKYQKQAVKLSTRVGEESARRVQIEEFDAIDSRVNRALSQCLNDVKVIRRRDQFSVFIPFHQSIASRLIETFCGLKDVNDLLAFAAYIRDQINSQLFVYALSIAILYRNDTKNLTLPSYAEIFPQKFVASRALLEAQETAQVFDDPADRAPIQIPRNFTGTDSDPEHRLAYFREDLGINLHHWHWHLVYPIGGPRDIVNKDRRGELFYYIHRQIVARYNVERLCNNLSQVKRLLEWDQPIEEAYFPMLTTTVAGRDWPPRPANMTLTNLVRPDMRLLLDIEDLKRYKERIYEAIHGKRVIATDGTEIRIDNERGIDVLGNLVEASSLTPNSDYYGNLHNSGHNMIAYIHDPENKYAQNAGVMSETTTAMRDPIFYRWHSFIDDIFIEHKNTLTPYDVASLTFEGIEITDLELRSFDRNGAPMEQKNVLNTFMMCSDINLSRGLDFQPRGTTLVRFPHLNHNDFMYSIRVNNRSGRNLTGTVRIFMAPELGSANTRINFAEQRNLMIEMDRFVAILRPGNSRIDRRSTSSSVTIPFEQTFRNLTAPTNAEETEVFNYCGCGWPQHMLVPKGTAGGYRMILFAMISDYEQDRADESRAVPSSCKTSVSFCGLRDRIYPDRKPMGYPFDRRPRTGVTDLGTFLTPNMRTRPIVVIHSESVGDCDPISQRNTNNGERTDSATSATANEVSSES